MAKPIKDTPILSGKDADRFVELMNTPRPEAAEVSKRRKEAYLSIRNMFV